MTKANQTTAELPNLRTFKRKRMNYYCSINMKNMIVCLEWDVLEEQFGWYKLICFFPSICVWNMVKLLNGLFLKKIKYAYRRTPHTHNFHMKHTFEMCLKNDHFQRKKKFVIVLILLILCKVVRNMFTSEVIESHWTNALSYHTKSLAR